MPTDQCPFRTSVNICMNASVYYNDNTIVVNFVKAQHVESFQWKGMINVIEKITAESSTIQ